MTHKQIGDILKEHIHFSGQLDGYVIHGAIQAIYNLHQEEIDLNNKMHSRNRDQLVQAILLLAKLLPYARQHGEKHIVELVKEVEKFLSDEG